MFGFSRSKALRVHATRGRARAHWAVTARFDGATRTARSRRRRARAQLCRVWARVVDARRAFTRDDTRLIDASRPLHRCLTNGSQDHSTNCTAAMEGIFSRSFCVTATRTVITFAAGPVRRTLTMGSSISMSSSTPPPVPAR